MEPWWVVTHFEGRRKKKRIGPTKADRRQAEEIAKKVNAAIALGSFGRASSHESRALPCDAELRRWHTTYSATMKPSHQRSTDSLIRHHLRPHFGSKDLRQLREPDLLQFAKANEVKCWGSAGLMWISLAVRSRFDAL